MSEAGEMRQDNNDTNKSAAAGFKILGVVCAGLMVGEEMEKAGFPQLGVIDNAVRLVNELKPQMPTMPPDLRSAMEVLILSLIDAVPDRIKLPEGARADLEDSVKSNREDLGRIMRAMLGGGRN